MRFRVPPSLFETLMARQRGRGYVDQICPQHDAVWLHTDMGPSYYLTRDGAVLADDVVLGTPLGEIEGRDACAALVMGARTIDSPELLELLPPRPVLARDCSRC